MLNVRYCLSAKAVAKVTASLATVVVGLVGFAGEAHAQDFVPSGVVQIHNQIRDDSCMGVSGGVMQPGQPVIQWNCESISASPDQYWTFVLWGTASFAPGDGHLYEIVNNKDPSYCLEGDPGAGGNPQGGPVVVNPCSSGTGVQWNQFWQGYSDGFSTLLYNVWEGTVAAVAGASTDNAAAIILWDNQTGGVGNHPEQLWAFTSP